MWVEQREEERVKKSVRRGAGAGGGGPGVGPPGPGGDLARGEGHLMQGAGASGCAVL